MCRLSLFWLLSVASCLFDRAQALLNRPEDELERQDRGARASKLRTRLLGAVLDREYLLYRSYFSYQREGRACVLAAAEGSGHRPRGQKVWQVKDWQPCIPRWVWEELQKGQRDPREVNRHDHLGCISHKTGRWLKNRPAVTKWNCIHHPSVVCVHLASGSKNL